MVEMLSFQLIFIADKKHPPIEMKSVKCKVSCFPVSHHQCLPVTPWAMTFSLNRCNKSKLHKQFLSDRGVNETVTYLCFGLVTLF